jgi:hypothetical protein
MQDGPSGGQDQPRVPDPAPPQAADPVGPADPLAAEAEELRRLIEAGASSPEELRALAARLREHRQREEARWRAEVKPQLVKQGKGRLRRQAAPPPLPTLPGLGPTGAGTAPGPATGVPTTPAPAEPAPGARALWIGLGLLAMVGVAVLAARTTVWVLVLPVVALLVWAWSQGRDAAS